MTFRARVAGLLALLALAPTANARAAGSYVVDACSPGANDAWTFSTNSAQFQSGQECPAMASGYTGLWLHDRVPSTGDMVDGATAGWTFTAPAGLTITQLVDRHYFFKEDDDDYKPELRTAEGAVLATCSIQSGNTICTSDAAGGGPIRTYSGLSTTGLWFGARCVTGNPSVFCVNGGTQPRIGMMLYEAHVTIADGTAPTVGAATGNLFSGGWVSGSRTAGATASDTSGVLRELVRDGATDVASADRSCSFTRPRPCDDVGSAPAIAVDTTRMADGAHQVTVAASDAAGNTASGPAQTVQIDNHAPAAPIGLASAQGQTTAAAAVDVSWTDPVGQAAPITAANWSRCPETGACETGTVAGGPLHLAMPEGIQRVSVWLQDAAGNSDPKSAAVLPVTVDRTAPSAPSGLHGDVSSDGHQVTLSWQPPGEQVAAITRAHYELCRTGSGCVTGTADSASSATVALAAAGSYTARVWLEDAAGNSSADQAAQTTFTAATGPSGTPTPTPTPGKRVSAGLKLTRTLRGTLLTVTARANSKATGTVRVTVKSTAGPRVSRARAVKLKRGRVTYAIHVPRTIRRLALTARYSGDARYLPATATRTLIHR